jgi:pimeloyl-ACP methyl ester carboxylesterase
MTSDNARSEEIVVETPSRRFVTQVIGSGPGLLLLLHGYPLDSRMWNKVIPLLASCFQCIAPDLRGFGRNQEESRSFTIADLADDCSNILDALQIQQPVTVCGLSMGGYVAMEFVERHREQVGAVVLTNTRPHADDELGAQTRRNVAAGVIKNGVQATLEPMLSKLLCERTFTEQKELLPTVQDMMFQSKASTVAWAQLAMTHRRDFRTLMPAWNLPTLCLGGDHDAITPPAMIEEMAAAIPDSQLRILQDAGHLAPLEQPIAFAEQLRNFASTQ